MKFLTQVRDFAKILVISLLIIVPIRYYVAQPFFVRGASMEPAFHDGEYLVIDELSYRFGEPERGEVIVFKFPLNTSQFYIKRIIGLPGETVAIKDSTVVIMSRGEEVILDETWYLSDGETVGEIEITLKEDEYFVMGDNRSASSDSRRWGALSDSFIVGKVFIRALPFNKFEVY